MDWKTKYKISFINIQGIVYYVLIQKDGYTGNIINMISSKTPVIITYAGEGKGLYEQHTFGSKLDLSIISTVLEEYGEFLEITDKEYKVVLMSPGSDTSMEYNASLEFLPESSSDESPFTYTHANQRPYINFQSIINDCRLGWDSNYPYNEQYRKLRINFNDGIIYEIDAGYTYGPGDNVAINHMTGSDALFALLQTFCESRDLFSTERLVNYDPDYIYLYAPTPDVDNKYTYFNGFSVKIERYECSQGVWHTVYDGAFADGWWGNAVKLWIDDGSTLVIPIDLTDNIYQSKNVMQEPNGTTFISEIIEAVNSPGAEYHATLDEINPCKINIKYTGIEDITDYTLKVDNIYGVHPMDFNLDIIGFTENSIENDIIYWQGYLLPGTLSQSYIHPPYRIKLEATDGIADLENSKYISGNARLSLMRVISTCLQKTELKLNIKSYLNDYEDNTNNGDEYSPLSQIYIKEEILIGLSFREILENILSIFGLYLRQANNMWEICYINQVGSNKYRLFDFDGNQVTYGEDENKIRIGNEDSFRLNTDVGVNEKNSGVLELLAAVPKIEYTQDYGLKQQLVKDPTFSIIDGNNDLVYWGIPARYDSDGIYYIGVSTASYPSQTIQVTNESITFTLDYGGKIDLKLSINNLYYFDENGQFPENPIVHIIHLDSDDTATSGEETQATFEVILDLCALYESFPGAFTNGVAELNINMFVYGPASIRKVNVSTGVQVPKGLGKTKYYDVDGFKKDVFKKELTLGDVFVSEWSNLRYLYTLLLENGEQTTTWDGEPIIEKTLNTMSRELCKASRKIKGKFQFKGFINPTHYMLNIFDVNKYRLEGGVLDLRNCSLKACWVQVGKTIPGTVITKNGIFEGDASGIGIYADDRSGFTNVGGNGGLMEIPAEYVKRSELLNTIKGFLGVFTGFMLDSNNSIIITHNLERSKVIVIIAVNNKPLETANYVVDTNGDVNSLTITIMYPHQNETEFNYRIL